MKHLAPKSAETFPSEFDRQVQILLKKVWPHTSGIKKDDFLARILPLKKRLKSIPDTSIHDYETGKLPFVIVLPSSWLSPEKYIPLIKREGKTATLSMDPVKPGDFKTIESVKIPNEKPYLVIDLDRGKETLNVTPEKAFDLITGEKRSPLTIEEGLSIVLHHPDFLMKNNCFSLLASRREDLRVPAIWISGEKRPKLGWCWWRNPHTWLGSASCALRFG